MSRAGNLPIDLGLVDISPTEMMFWMYLPISVPGDHSFHILENLRQFIPIIREARWSDPEMFADRFVYLTAKTLWVGGDYIGNRPGWHIDGYGTEDINFIWADHAPTDFLSKKGGVDLSDDCDISLCQMADLGKWSAIYGLDITTYPDKHLLRLDNTVIHRSPVRFKGGMRSFVKVSLSPDRYNLVGNSINHLLPSTLDWPRADRAVTRNHPAQA